MSPPEVSECKIWVQPNRLVVAKYRRRNVIWVGLVLDHPARSFSGSHASSGGRNGQPHMPEHNKTGGEQDQARDCRNAVRYPMVFFDRVVCRRTVRAEGI